MNNIRYATRALLLATVYVCGCVAHPALPYGFNVVWNVPARGCEETQPFNLSQYSVLTNANDTWFGNEDNIFYSIGSWPYYSNGQPVNGGVPQNASLEAHLKQVEVDIDATIPDVNFAGLAIIDWEAWRPLWAWNFDALNIYQHASINLTRARHPDWNSSQIEAQAEADFNAGAEAFFAGTLKTAQRLRPNGLWGYYQLPYCYGYANGSCGAAQVANDDQVQWLWDAADVAFTEIYQGSYDVNLTEWTSFVAARTQEAVRVMSPQRRNSSRPGFVLPYGNIVSTRTFPNGTTARAYLTEDDLKAQIETAANVGADGVVIWGSSGDVSSAAKCDQLRSFIESPFGPTVKNIVAEKTACVEKYCHDHGRCVELPKSESPTCRCSYGHSGPSCDKNITFV